MREIRGEQHKNIKIIFTSTTFKLLVGWEQCKDKSVCLLNMQMDYKSSRNAREEKTMRIYFSLVSNGLKRLFWMTDSGIY